MGKRGPARKYTPEQLEERIEAYFQYCDDGREVTRFNKRGEPETAIIAYPYTVLGLADFLDVTLQCLSEYQERPETGAMVTRAKQRCARSWLEGGAERTWDSNIARFARVTIRCRV